MKLLIVEDEPDLLSTVCGYLGREGYRCEEAATYKEAVQRLQAHDYDGVVLDLNLPDGDGMRLLKAVRQYQEDALVLITSARDTLEDRLAGFSGGSDDYLVKPYHLSELNARLKAMERRRHFAGRDKLVFEELEVDIDEREARVDGKPLQLTRKEFDILLYLVRNKNKVVTKDSLAEHLWGDYMEDAASFDFIYSHIKNLRRKLAAAGCAEYLRNIYGIGYKFRFPA
jgi:DNA-binding response OmpR family regulator